MFSSELKDGVGDLDTGRHAQEALVRQQHASQAVEILEGVADLPPALQWSRLDMFLCLCRQDKKSSEHNLADPRAVLRRAGSPKFSVPVRNRLNEAIKNKEAMMRNA